ncbi:hypothetical protein EDF23_103338 [Curtobacterium sp. PhB128]|nr:hypothetical protein EDF23_103338 [Curtobacterium sp. PhB128]TCL97260.1 hypothetical protein EDF29_10346 [Curtobacterium sp. PhB138]
MVGSVTATRPFLLTIRSARDPTADGRHGAAPPRASRPPRGALTARYGCSSAAIATRTGTEPIVEMSTTSRATGTAAS